MLANRNAKPAALAAALVLLLAPATSAQKARPKKRSPQQQRTKSSDPAVLQLRELLYCDKTLDQFIDFGRTEEGELNRPLALIKAGDVRGAAKLLDEMGSRAEVTADSDYWLILAKARRAAGDAEGARQAVRKLFSLPDSETRMTLQAWSILRELGERPPEATADNVLGVVAEVADGEGVIVVAGYEDGTYRFFSDGGGGLIGSPVDEKAIAAAKNLTSVARQLAARLPYDSARPLPKPGRVRFALLTPGGARAAEEDVSAAESGTSKLSPLYSSAFELLKEMVRILKEGRQG